MVYTKGQQAPALIDQRPELLAEPDSPHHSRFAWADHANPANLLTALNLLGGVAATGLAVSGRTRPAAIALLTATVFDLADGSVARATGSDGHVFGHVYEGGADLVTCGPGAAAIFYYGDLAESAPVTGALLAGAWVSAVNLRLTRYTVIGHGNTFMGCPAPLAAVTMAAVTLLPLPPRVTAGVAAVLSAGMVMSFPIPTADTARKWLRRVLLGRT